MAENDIEALAVEQVALALCENALGGKRCPCKEAGKFNCAEEYPGQQARAALTALRSTTAEPFQQRVQPWLMACFGEVIAGDREERNHRFLEEALELVQACGCTAHEARQLVDYTYGRPAGEPAQEVGGVMVTLAALCLANGLDMHGDGETELARVWTQVEQIRAKQAAKPKHSPLPVAPHLTALRSTTAEPVEGAAEAPWHTVALDKAIAELAKAGDDLSLMAQTSGGIARADQSLIAAIAHWDAAREKAKQVARIVRFEWDSPAIGAGVMHPEAHPTDSAAKDTEIARAADLMKAIQHSVQMAMVPGNDWRRELRLIQGLTEVALANRGEAGALAKERGE